MDKFIKISIGYNCNPKRYLKDISDQPTHYFDYLGTSAWSLYKLFLNNFEDHVNLKE